MASQSSSSSSNVQHLNKQNQLPNSNSVVQEHNFFSHVQVGSSSAFPNNNEGKDENNSEKNNSDSKIYSCNYCKGEYSSLQALGGHQNAHKAERALQMQLIKQKYEGSAFNSEQPRFNPYSNYPITPFTPYNYMPHGPRIGHGTFTPYNNRPLGVRMESSIQKSPCISPRIGLGAFRLHDILNPSLVSMRNNIEGSNGGVASPGIGGATTSANVVAPTSTVDGIRKLKSSDFDSSGLDLSLKL
ncbi:zinc finger protein [Trifolium repens]|nr:zinc finger protein [Trifolium repens]